MPLSEIESNLSLTGAIVKYYRYIYPDENVCSGCWNKMYTKLKSIDIDKLQAMADSEYKLKPGVWAMKFGSTQHISNLNISNALAEEFLRINENRISLFTEFPADWKERVMGVSPKVGKMTAKPSAPKKPRVYKKKA